MSKAPLIQPSMSLGKMPTAAPLPSKPKTAKHRGANLGKWLHPRKGGK